MTMTLTTIPHTPKTPRKIVLMNVEQVRIELAKVEDRAKLHMLREQLCANDGGSFAGLLAVVQSLHEYATGAVELNREAADDCELILRATTRCWVPPIPTSERYDGLVLDLINQALAAWFVAAQQLDVSPKKVKSSKRRK